MKSHSNDTTKTGVSLICMADLKLDPIVWIWKDWLAVGKCHLLVGAPGTGKSTLALNLASTITRGAQWPDGSKCRPDNVLIWSVDDSLEDTVLPRLIAQAADPNRVYAINDVLENNHSGAFDPSQELSKLYQRISEIGDIQLIIIDPIVNLVSGDPHKNGRLRRALQPLVELGEKCQVAILGISYFTKGSRRRNSLECISGSIACGALFTTKVTDLNGQMKHLLVRTKSNYSPEGGYYYQIEGTELADHKGIFASQVIWGAPVVGKLLFPSSHQSV